MYESEACSGDEEVVKAAAAAAEIPSSPPRLRSRRHRGPKRRRVDVSSDDLSTPSMDLFPDEDPASSSKFGMMFYLGMNSVRCVLGMP